MSRLFLKLQEELIDVKAFRDITSRILKDGKIDPREKNGTPSKPSKQIGRAAMHNTINLNKVNGKCYTLITL